MRIAVISDIHGNLEALLEVLADIDQSQIDQMINLGDNIGYGPDPEKVVQCMIKRQIPCIMGNHELSILDPALLAWFNPNARKSLKKTEKMLSVSSLQYIQALARSMVAHGCRFVHGFPPDSPTTYLFQVDRMTLKQTFDSSQEPLCFTGHTHRPEIIADQGEGETFRNPLGQEIVRLDPRHKYIVNVGSVGQPRDGDCNAKYVIWDTAHKTLEVRYVPYDITATAKKIIALGFPRSHAERLWCS